jgi:hypothetical protein
MKPEFITHSDILSIAIIVDINISYPIIPSVVC